MRRNFGIILTLALVIGVLIGLSAAGRMELDRPPESELEPIRTSYSTGPTGTRAFYQLLEESGKYVSRWRESYLKLDEMAKNEVLVAVGPFQMDQTLSSEESRALQKWIAAGGRALIVSRFPIAQFGDPVIHSAIVAKAPDWKAPPELLVDPKSDELIVQPTELTANLSQLALSHLAARMKFYPPILDEPDEESEQDETKVNAPASPTPPGTEPSPTPEPPPEEEPPAMLYAPVIHMGDEQGAVLADFHYGEGRVIFLSDPFVIANNGINRGSNLVLTLNLVNALIHNENNPPRKIFFDEFHHGFRDTSNPLVNYFRGTPMPWLLGQGLILGILMIYTYGRRFARPLPLPRIDRHSPLEFVGSMANLQQVARARELALENIYPRFKVALCRRLGLSSRAATEEILKTAHRRGLPIDATELRKAIAESQLAIQGEKLDDAQLVKTVSRMRRIMKSLKGV